MAEPTRHIVSDYNLWPICWDTPTSALGFHNPMVRVNQTWNEQCVFSSLEYHCNVPCCVPMDDFNKNFPDGGDEYVKNFITRNETELDLSDPAWKGHFARYKCNNTNGTDFCVGGGDSCETPNCDSRDKIVTYECVCDLCVFDESFLFLAPVGIIFTATLTYTGFILLAIGSLWNADIVTKMKKISQMCKELKEQKAREKAKSKAEKDAGTGQEALLPVALPKSPEKGEGEEECAT